MVKFVYASGKEVVYDYDWEKLAPKLQFAGIRLFKPEKNVLIPLNSHTIAVIENMDLEEEVDEQGNTEALDDIKAEEPDKEEDPEKELTKQEKQDKMLAHMKEMSECTHEEYDIYYQMVTAGPKNSPREQQRFFPVCKKCGVRQRNMKSASLTDEQKENAKVWDK